MVAFGFVLSISSFTESQIFSCYPLFAPTSPESTILFWTYGSWDRACSTQPGHGHVSLFTILECGYFHLVETGVDYQAV
jgi:hypothetical protein